MPDEQDTRAPPGRRRARIEGDSPSLDVAVLKAACSSCSLREICLPIGLTRNQVEALDELVYTRRKLKRGTALYNAGDAFDKLYAIRNGFFKTSMVSEDGQGQITGFQMAGEILGLDGIGSGRHGCDAIALEDSDVCVIPFARLEDLAHQIPSLQKHIHRLMSREIVRDHDVMMMLGGMRADERLAVFLLDLSQRFTARGYSPSEFILRMTREEIGRYLGLKLETVSRVFSNFQENGLLSVRQKHIHITNADGLKSRVRQNTLQ